MVTKTKPITPQSLVGRLPEEQLSNTEAALSKRFAASLYSGHGGTREPERILLSELDGLQGRPDLVDAKIVALPGSVNLDSLAACLRSPTKARLLALLKYGAPRRREYLRRLTALSESSLSGHVRNLEESGLVIIQDHGAVSLACPLPWNMVNLVSYEIKISNWRRALHQAIGYRSFAHSSWVVMPKPGAARAEAIESVFLTNGIGLISIGDFGVQKVEIKAKNRQTTASRRLYLMGVGIILSTYLGERRRLHRRLLPESIQRF